MTWLVVWSSLLFALGLLLGGRVGIWLEERSAARKRRERREERRAARWLAGVRETRGGTVMPHRPPEVAHEPDPEAAERRAAMARRTHPVFRQRPPELAFPAWSLLNADPPTLGEEVQAMIANADAVPSVRWLDRLEQLWAPRASAVPGCPAAHAASTDGSRG